MNFGVGIQCVIQLSFLAIYIATQYLKIYEATSMAPAIEKLVSRQPIGKAN